jgi:hypothetical protein
LIIVPHGRGHVLSDHPKTRPKPISQLIKGGQSGCHLMEFGGGDALTRMICGLFQFDNEASSPLRSILPPLIHLKHEQSRLGEWLEPTLKMPALEACQPRPGSETLISLEHLGGRVQLEAIAFAHPNFNALAAQNGLDVYRPETIICLRALLAE